MLINKSKHLTKEKQIQLGSYYTPKELVDKVCEYIQPYILKNKENIIIFDNAAGCGAFVKGMEKYDYRVADCDAKAYNFLNKYLDNKKVFCTNSLIDVNRKKYNIPNSSFLIMVGNPPYNDITSEFKNGQKGKNLCDRDLFDRDLGVSFLKSYNKLRADTVCILHPLSYLIKETNFKRLKNFKNSYRLNKGIVFSSSWFSKTGSIKFPIMIGLYERNEKGMDFEYIRNFNFSILDEEDKFNLSEYETTDCFIDKYPPGKNGLKVSPIGLYYYTFRDFNSLRKNASFMIKQHYNGIPVTVQNFYKYAYLNALKNLFWVDNIWLYGNLSPLINKNMLEKNKNIYIEYAIQTNCALKNADKKIIQDITKYYGIDLDRLTDINKLENEITKQFKELTGIKKVNTKVIYSNKISRDKQLSLALEKRAVYHNNNKKMVKNVN